MSLATFSRPEINRLSEIVNDLYPLLTNPYMDAPFGSIHTMNRVQDHRQVYWRIIHLVFADIVYASGIYPRNHQKAADFLYYSDVISPEHFSSLTTLIKSSSYEFQEDV